ncbi:hypothetical protein TIFTF001_039964 [Ficus carica]|uniref:Uncharacterized protein n=1 Tax=Ficus carica TaxID=3494 RepID=A0AA88CX11_FICCA|nr:hypothetical protein TIFTF001_039952 [Ficus carica]GMN20735.1 hypothetical protein TIFTF001_039956 [Ficus carica]GMN20829.1 hypothetical protein TIFTF001_039961 [Ficus carica]GMN20877.1 hypothetical protein TIFTF001_039964 [Ficus carica]
MLGCLLMIARNHEGEVCKPWLAKEARLGSLGCGFIKASHEVLLPQVAGHGVALARLVHVLLPCGGRPWCLDVQALACQGTRLGGWLIQATSMRCLSLMWPVLVKPSETRLLIEP